MLAFALFAAAFQLSGVVHVVDANAGPYFEIQDAVDAAVDGETILVRTGSYQSFVVNNETLAIVGDAGATVLVIGAVRARYLAIGKQLVVQNLEARGMDTGNRFEKHGLYLHENDGSVRIQGCHFEGESYVPCPLLSGNEPAHGARIVRSLDVAISNCTLRGGRPVLIDSDGHSSPGHGFVAEESAVAVSACNARGRDGATCCDGLSGGDGVRFERSFAFVAGCVLRGGVGGSGMLCYCALGGHGGSGLRLAGESQGWLLPNDALGGNGGPGNGGFSGTCADNGNSGSPIRVETPAWAWTLSSTVRRTLLAESPVRAGSTITLTIRGHASDRLRLVSSEVATNVLVPEWSTMLHVDLSATTNELDLGLVGSTQTTITLPVAPLPPGRQSRVLHLQVFHDQLGVGTTMGNSATVVVLDPSL